MTYLSSNIRRSLAPGGALIVSIILAVSSYSATPAKAYAFPNLFIGAMVVLSFIWLLSELFTRTPQLFETVPWMPVACGILLMSAYLLTAQLIGFLYGSLCTFVATGVGFCATTPTLRSGAITILSGIVFMALVYFLFNIFLKVQIPTGSVF